jgi:hypothetical protein
VPEQRRREGRAEIPLFEFVSELKSENSIKRVVGMAVPTTKNPPISGYDAGLLLIARSVVKQLNDHPVHGVTFPISLIYR